MFTGFCLFVYADVLRFITVLTNRAEIVYILYNYGVRSMFALKWMLTVVQNLYKHLVLYNISHLFVSILLGISTDVC